MNSKRIAHPTRSSRNPNNQHLYQECYDLRRELNQHQAENRKIKVKLQSSKKRDTMDLTGFTRDSFRQTDDPQEGPLITHRNQSILGRNKAEDPVGKIRSNFKICAQTTIPPSTGSLPLNRDQQRDQEIARLKQQNYQLKKQIQNLTQKTDSPSNPFPSIKIDHKGALSLQVSSLKYKNKKLQEQPQRNIKQKKINLEEKSKKLQKERVYSLKLFSEKLNQAETEIKSPNKKQKNLETQINYIAKEFEQLGQKPNREIQQKQVQLQKLGVLFPEADFYPDFFNHNLIDETRVIKVLKGPNACLRAFYYQLFQLIFQIQADDCEDKAQADYSEFFLNQLSNIALLVPQKAKQTQKIRQFIQELLAEGNLDFQSHINMHPEIDQIMVDILQCLSKDIRQDTELFSNLPPLLQIFNLEAAKYGDRCLKFYQSDTFMYIQSSSEIYLAYCQINQ